MRYLSHPFEMAKHTVDEGLRLNQSLDKEPNDRTQHMYQEGPLMHHTEFVRVYGKNESLPYIPWVARANPERYAHLMPRNDMNFTKVW